MKIAAAQIQPRRGDVAENIARHLAWIASAAAAGADAIFFPELSLTGYEPELAAELATTVDDPRLAVFQAESDAANLTIGAGLPIRSEVGITISMVIFQPRRPRQVYSKQHLHSDELPYFVQGAGQLLVSIGPVVIAPAICYESLLPEHAAQAFGAGAHVYMASVAKPRRGVDKAFTHYPEIARRYAAPVLMVNSIGPCDNFVGAGRTAAWTKDGALAGELDATCEGLVVFDLSSGLAKTIVGSPI